MKPFLPALAAVLATVAPSVAAGPSWTLPFQGVATDASGKPRPDGARSATFELFDAAQGGNSLWQEQVQVALRKGLFSLELGTQSPLPLEKFGTQPLWLAVSLEGDAGAHPRIPLGKSAEAWFAHRSLVAQFATTSDTAGFALRASQVDTALHARQASHARHADSSDWSKAAVSADTAKFASRAGYVDSSRYAGKSGASDTAQFARRAAQADSSSHAKLASRALLADSSAVSGRAVIADTAKSASRADTSGFARRSGHSDTAAYAKSTALPWQLKSPLAFNAGRDTIQLESGTQNGQFLTWNGSSWIAKSAVFQALAAGGSQAIQHRDPFQVVNFIIALNGLYPSRDGDMPFLGEIAMVGFNFAPRDWAPCDGRYLPIAQNSALFSLLGTTYGGNGVQTFALPDLRGRAPINQGAGIGLIPRSMGESGGTESIQILPSQMPQHTHQIQPQP